MRYLLIYIAVFTLAFIGHVGPLHSAEILRTEDLHKVIESKLAKDPNFLVQILGTQSYNDKSLATKFLNKLLESSTYRAQTNNWLLQQSLGTEDELIQKWLTLHHDTLSFTLWLLDEKKVALLHRLRNPLGEIDRKACYEKSTLREINDLIYQGLLNIKDDEISDLANSLALTYVKSYAYNEEQRKNIVAPVNVVMIALREELVLWPVEDQRKIFNAYSYRPKRSSDFKQNCETEWLAIQVATNPKAKNTHIVTRSVTDAAIADSYRSNQLK